MTFMKRRSFLTATAAAASASIAAPAFAQSEPKLNWRLVSAYPKSLDVIFNTATMLADHVRVLTNGKFNIQVFAAGELVPPFQSADAAAAGTVEMAYMPPQYNWGKDPTWALGSSIPFGLNTRQTNAWLYYGGGNDLLNDFYQQHGLYGLPCGNTSAQMGGWFRKEINAVEDLKGLKLRVGGYVGKVLEKLGAVPQAIPAGEIYTSLERGTIDAAEWIGPYDDEKLGLYKVAPYYYYPGWWEGQSLIYTFVNAGKWKELPPVYQQAVRVACEAVNGNVVAHYDHENPQAIRRLVANGAKLRLFKKEVLDACWNASNEVAAELSSGNANFKKIYDSQVSFRRDAYLWAQIAEAGHDNYMMSLQREGKL
ncbi:TRAP transporter substrate-binding protein [Castellaniella hirudinis]|uniref:TRAP transporter substrate-binding protein n=1 Tax=Castellaniella hirudinis TaxID=1144617 RepID=A0ABV8S445_9BURK